VSRKKDMGHDQFSKGGMRGFNFMIPLVTDH